MPSFTGWFGLLGAEYRAQISYEHFASFGIRLMKEIGIRPGFSPYKEDLRDACEVESLREAGCESWSQNCASQPGWLGRTDLASIHFLKCCIDNSSCQVLRNTVIFSWWLCLRGKRWTTLVLYFVKTEQTHSEGAKAPYFTLKVFKN